MNKSTFLERALERLGTDSGVKGGVSALWRIVPQPIPSEGLTRLRPKNLLTASLLTPMILSRFPFPNPLPPPFPARQCVSQYPPLCAEEYLLYLLYCYEPLSM